MNDGRIIVTITGFDKVGIVAKIANTLSDCSVNIEDIKQSIMQGCFAMMMLCNISSSPKSFKEIKEALVAAGRELDMEVWVQRKEIFDGMHTI